MALYAVNVALRPKEYNKILKEHLHEGDKDRFRDCTFVLSNVRICDDLTLELMFATTESPEIETR